MNHDLHKASECYGAFIEGKIVGFTAILHFPHPKEKRFKRIHRTVVMPDYQGLGIAKNLVNTVAQRYVDNGYRVITTTTNPQMTNTRKKDPRWVLRNAGRANYNATYKMSKTASWDRLTCSWEYVGNKKPGTKPRQG